MFAKHLYTDTISKVLQQYYGLPIKNIEYLSIGNDPNSTVYQVDDFNNEKFFLKINKGPFQHVGIKVPYYLQLYGIKEVIPPIVSKTGSVWIESGDYTYTLYPFIESIDGYKTELSYAQWTCFGQTLKKLQTIELPEELLTALPSEDFSSKWCDIVRNYDQQINTRKFEDPISKQLVDFWLKNRQDIIGLVENTERISEQLKQQKIEYVLCHADLHPGNLVITNDNQLLIVDWDNPILAPKERDLMFIGGGHRFKNENIDAFYEGYGKTEINQLALSYYRNERIVADIAVDSIEIFESKGSHEHREECLYLLTRQFEPNREVSVALNQ